MHMWLMPRADSFVGPANRSNALVVALSKETYGRRRGCEMGSLDEKSQPCLCSASSAFEVHIRDIARSDPYLEPRRRPAPSHTLPARSRADSLTSHWDDSMLLTLFSGTPQWQATSPSLFTGFLLHTADGNCLGVSPASYRQRLSLFTRWRRAIPPFFSPSSFSQFLVLVPTEER